MNGSASLCWLPPSMTQLQPMGCTHLSTPTLCQTRNCNDIAIFPLFSFVFSHPAPFRSVPLHLCPMIYQFSCISLIAVVHRTFQLCCADRCDLIAYMKRIRHMTLLKRLPPACTPRYHTTCSFRCILYKSILDEGYVLT